MPLPQAPSADRVAAVVDSVFAGAPYRWIERPSPWRWLSRWWDALVRWLEHFKTSSPLGFEVFLWAIIATLVLVLGHAIWVIVRTVRGSAAAPLGTPIEGSPQRGAAWYRADAERLEGAGLYREAMQARFAALVLDLDRRRVLRFHPAKTPFEYTAEPALTDAARVRLRDLVLDLYRFTFAGAPCDAASYAAWRSAAEPDRYAPAN